MTNRKLPFYKIEDPLDFEHAARNLFKEQYHNNKVYRSYCDLINCHPSDVFHVTDIPFLPIQFFKTHRITTFLDTPKKTFLSSSTTGQIPSKHHLINLEDYENSFKKCFEQFYGSITDYTVLALLPSYLERQDSSLVYMVEKLIQNSKKEQSGFYLNEWKDLIQTLKELDERGEKTLLLGVSFALLDLIAQEQFKLKHTLIMETGGMKGRRKEMIRDALHNELSIGFGVDKIHSEYGMTELLSQAYSKGDGIFECPPWMKVFVRSVEDPFQLIDFGRSGGLNIIDLANQNSCAFIATQDLGRSFSDNRFEVLGRFDSAEIRGCNLMVL